MKKPNRNNQVARRRWNLWHQDPHCHYCGKKLKWKETTLEHLYSKVKNGRLKGEREKKCSEVDVYTVLSCAKCNHEQQRKEIKERKIGSKKYVFSFEEGDEEDKRIYGGIIGRSGITRRAFDRI